MKKLILILILIITTCLYSTIINVPADQPTIQAGIDAATETDTVLVAEGTYFENINFNGKAISVASNYIVDADPLHINNTIINGSQPVNPDLGSCVKFESGEGNESVLCGFTLTEGTGNYNPVSGNISAGGIYCTGSSPSIVSNIVTNNLVQYSAGICIIDNSSPIILNNEISNNTAGVNTGGIGFWNNSNAFFEGNTVSNNSAGDIGGVGIGNSSPILSNNIISGNSTSPGGAGGIFIQYNSNPELIGNVISDNTANSQGGGIYIYSSGDNYTTIENCLISGNIAGTTGGGISLNIAEVDITSCLISDNEAGTYGGGLYIHASSNVNITYSLVLNNSAASDGGGIENGTSSPMITNCTIYGNDAPGCGSQIDCWSGGLEAVNTIIGGSSSNGSIYFNTSSHTFNYCDFKNSVGPDFAGSSVPQNLGVINSTNANDDPCDEFMNILLDPLFVDLLYDDFHLSENSPCIDAGDPTFPLDPYGTCVEIGRYCFDPTDLNENTIVKTHDFLHQNYPNPFNPSTTISFNLPEEQADEIELSIYNLKGQKVKTLVNKDLESGDHTIKWNGTDDNNHLVSSGIYFYKLKTENYEKTKKMILMK